MMQWDTVGYSGMSLMFAAHLHGRGGRPCDICPVREQTGHADREEPYKMAHA